MTLTWDEIMAVGLPPLHLEGTERQIEHQFEALFRKREGSSLLDPARGSTRAMNIDLSRFSLQQVVIQFRALGLITPSVRKRSLKDDDNYWKLTPYGMTVMTRLCAIQREGRTVS